jgi:hypothetical protein
MRTRLTAMRRPGVTPGLPRCAVALGSELAGQACPLFQVGEKLAGHLDGLTPFLAPLSPAPVQETGRRRGVLTARLLRHPVSGSPGRSSTASSPLRLDLGVLNWLSSIGPLASGGPTLGRPGRSCPVPGCGRHPERAGVGRPAAGAERLVEAGQAAGRGRRLHGDVASLGVHYQGRPRRVARAAGCRPAGHRAPAGRRAGLAPVSRATSATSSSS